MPRKTEAAAAIERSITHGEIVTIDHSPEAIEELSRACDDSVTTSGEDDCTVVEYWGTDDDGNSWRVHTQTERPPYRD